jgi:hypothetical protein
MPEAHGSKTRLLIDPAGTLPGTPVVAAGVTAATFDGSRDRVDVTAFGDTNKRVVQGLPNYAGTFAGVWNSDDLTLLEAAMAGDPVVLRLVPNYDDEPGIYLSGLGVIDFSLSSGVSAAVTISGSYAATSNWTLTQPA